GDNSFITGRRGLLPPSYPRRPSYFFDREVAERKQEKGDAVFSPDGQLAWPPTISRRFENSRFSTVEHSPSMHTPEREPQ
ncbi:MAG: hypothetical protein M3R38_06695, partial [Actinomycetota bacterium]|nr:hypothetical protein [Actinomycetota bacterium]